MTLGFRYILFDYVRYLHFYLEMEYDSMCDSVDFK